MIDRPVFENPKCMEYSQELWYPPLFDDQPGPTGSDAEYFEIAKMVCSVCPHNTECRQRGTNERWGVWGGTTPVERRREQYRPSKRLMSDEALTLIPGPGHRVDIKQLTSAINKVTRKRPVA